MEQGYNFRRAGQRPPWLEGELSSGAKFGLLALWALAAMFGMFGLVMTLAMGVQVADGRGEAMALLVGVVCLALGVAGLWFTMPRLRYGTRFTPSYAPIPPHAPGQIFDARFSRPGVKRSFQGKGTIQFHPQHLVVSGTLMPSTLLQLGVVVLLTALPLVVFGIGLGVLPALIIGGLIGRKKWMCSVPYHLIRDLTITGCHLRFASAEMQPQFFRVQLSSADGERLYRELGMRFPAALPSWQG